MRRGLFSAWFQGPLPHYVLFWLEQLRRHCDQVWLLTTADWAITDSDVAILRQLDVRWRIVPNRGRDFGMYFHARDLIDPDHSLVLANDSCLLFRPLDPYFDWVRRNRVHYAGLTDSLERGYHVQSYLLSITPPAVEAVREYLERSGVVADDTDVIRVYELGLSRALSARGFRVRSQYPTHTWSAGNATVRRARRLIRTGAPMLKRSATGGVYAYIKDLRQAVYTDRHSVNLKYLLEGFPARAPREGPGLPTPSAGEPVNGCASRRVARRRIRSRHRLDAAPR